MAEPTQPDSTPSALAQWNAAVQAYLDAGIGQLAASELVNKERPGLWAQAMAEAARRPPTHRTGRAPRTL